MTDAVTPPVGELFLGGSPDVDPPASAPIFYESERFTTHGVLVGMTGSGKTGLAMVMLEELLAAGIPALIIDPKGDMGNLCFMSTECDPADFVPWVEAADAKQRQTKAAEVAATWRDGRASWGVLPERVAQVKAADRVIYTPGSSAGIPLNVVGSLAAPPDFSADQESYRDEIASFVSGLLALVDIEADPLSSREHILLSNLIENAWRQGSDLDLADLIGQVVTPPLRKLGVFELETFYPDKERQALAMRLNALVASPNFAPWMEGQPLDIQSLLYSPDGSPRAPIMYLAHLSDAERQFMVTLLMSKMVTWTRRQTGTSALRAVVYMDEVFGYCPPTASPPSKAPILTMLKQARAFGVGLILSTQNPVDLDYKAMSNAGTWLVGRLQTERDKARILEGMRSAQAGQDTSNLDQLIGSLGKREFILHSTKADQPVRLTSRWAMSYLRGPLTKDEVRTLGQHRDDTVASSAAPSGLPTEPSAQVERPQEPAATSVANGAARPVGTDDTIPNSFDELPIAPKVAKGIRVAWLDPAAEWTDISTAPTSDRFEAALACTVSLTFDETRAGLDHRETWEAVLFPIPDHVDPTSWQAVDHDPRDFKETPPATSRYVAPEAPIDNATFFKTVEKDLEDYLARDRVLTIYQNPQLKLFSRIDETPDAFVQRCVSSAEAAADAELAKLRDRYAARERSAREKVAAAERRVAQLETDKQSSGQRELIDGASDLLGAFLGGRRRSRSMRSAGASIRRASQRRETTTRNRQKAEVARDQYDDAIDEMADLERQLQDDIDQIGARWSEKAKAIETLDVGLERNDVAVTDLRLVWIPVAP
ncbi:MAG: DUF853 family protein [Acidimicrobiia bacterium]|nr:DUF853 family protein [Acidimicrobiia bacterium]MBP8179879.1 DUF853 family protein [Acidimicrobiia bacterium]